jgi:Uma2 family endonuclease
MADQATLPAPKDAAALEPQRRKFTADDVFRMIDAEIIGYDERVELIDGEILVLSPQSTAHFQVKNRLGRWFIQRGGDDFAVFIEPTYRLPNGDLVDPDLAILRSEDAQGALAAEKTILMIEVAISSEGYDRKVKAPRYARSGVREYWVVNAETRAVLRLLHPRPDGTWGAETAHGPSDLLTPADAPALAVRLADL